MWKQEHLMIQVLVHHEVADYESWRSGLRRGARLSPPVAGESSCRIFRKAGNPNDLTPLFEWEDMERAKRHMSSDELRKKMQQAGGVCAPEIDSLAETYTVRRSAAD